MKTTRLLVGLLVALIVLGGGPGVLAQGTLVVDSQPDRPRSTWATWPTCGTR